MGRLLRISIYAVIILVLYFWITAIIKTYSDKNKISDVISNTDTISNSDTFMDTNSYSILDTSKVITNEEIVDGSIDYDAVDKKIKSLKGNENSAPATNQAENINKDKTKSENIVKPAQKTSDQPIKNVNISENKTNQKTAPKPKIHEIGDGGQFMVMAGSYLLRENAEKMVKKLKKMGFSNAKTVVFSSSQYHSVVAAQHSSQAKAQEASAELKRKGIDSFVKTK